MVHIERLIFKDLFRNTIMWRISMMEKLNLSIWTWVDIADIALRHFLLHIEAISQQEEARSRDYALLLFWMTWRVPYSAQYHRQHCTLHAFGHFGALYMPNHYDKYPARPGFEHGTWRLQAQSIRIGTAIWIWEHAILQFNLSPVVIILSDKKSSTYSISTVTSLFN